MEYRNEVVEVVRDIFEIADKHLHIMANNVQKAPEDSFLISERFLEKNLSAFSGRRLKDIIDGFECAKSSIEYIKQHLIANSEIIRVSNS